MILLLHFLKKRTNHLSSSNVQKNVMSKSNLGIWVAHI